MLILIFLLCVGCGVIYALDLFARRRQIEQVLHLIRYLRREIRCFGAPLNQILSSPRCPSDLPFLHRMDFSEPFDLSAAYENAKRSCKGEMLFSDKEWDAADRLFLSLGQGDLSEQENQLSLAESAFSEAERDARESLGKNGKPAIVLGCSLGAVLVLMLL